MILFDISEVGRLLNNRHGSGDDIAIFNGREIRSGSRFTVGGNVRVSSFAPRQREPVPADAFLEERFHIILPSSSQRNTRRSIRTSGEVAVILAAGQALLRDH